MTFGLDADFSEEAFVGRLNADLANDLGNLVSRATTLIVNFAAGPARAGDAGRPRRRTIRERRGRGPAAWSSAAMEEFAFQRALAAIWEFIGAVNRYVDATQPWALAKEPAAAPAPRPRAASRWPTRCATSASCSTRSCPRRRRRSARRSDTTAAPRLADAELGRPRPPAARCRSSPASSRASTTKDAGADQPAAATGGKAAQPSTGRPAEPAAHRPSTTSRRIDLRVAEVVAAEARAEVQEAAQAHGVAGPASNGPSWPASPQHYAPADLVGKKVVVVANLEPAKLMGLESQGMVLAGSTDGDGALAVLMLDRDLPPGPKVTRDARGRYVEAIVQVGRARRLHRRACSARSARSTAPSAPARWSWCGAHLRTHAAAADVLECVQALRDDDVARRIAERLGPPG